jgi:ribosomal RNA-processing protein 8
VHSFDLVATNDRVVACDIAHVPLGPATVDVVVICLALMGTNYVDFLVEARRILKPAGRLLIAEVESRLESEEAFVQLLHSLGFDCVKVGDTRGLRWIADRAEQRKNHRVFYQFEFVRTTRSVQRPAPEAAAEALRPCLYKRR